MGAALAAASVALQDIDPAYSSTLLDQARQFYDFARANQGFYSDSIPDAQSFYRCAAACSSGWLPDHCWMVSLLRQLHANYGHLVKQKP
jgi:hypothetical protein